MIDSSEYTTVVPPKDLKELIAELHKIFSKDEVNADYVIELLSAYKSNPKDWKMFAKFDAHKYTRNLIDTGNGKFNLMALCWGEGQGSSIHSHSNADCFVKVLDGKLMETRYNWPSESQGEQPMQIIGRNVYEKNGVTYINDSMGLHRMENPSHSDTAITMHLYCPPFDECTIFDERTSHKNNVKFTFWSEYGERLNKDMRYNGCTVTKDHSIGTAGTK